MRICVGLIAVAAIALAVTGCHRSKQGSAARVPQTPAPPARLSEIELRSYRPNEAGAIMVIMYHKIESGHPNSPMYWSPDDLRKDLETLYQKGYRPVTLSEMAGDRMDVPAGKTPVVLTFDDSCAGQFVFAPGSTDQPDPNCAVGIMEDMHRRHPDWATKATFFVLAHTQKYAPPFGDLGTVSAKFDYLLRHGYEIGNHTTTHSDMRHMSADEVQTEIATAVRDIRRFEPTAKITSLALPYGSLPRDHAARKALGSGEQGGTQYHNTAVALAAWRPVMAPTTKASAGSLSDRLARFDPMAIERFAPVGDATLPHPLDFYIKYFDENPGYRYVSDGNPNVVAVPRGMERYLDEARLKAEGKTVQVYSSGPAPVGGSVPPPR